MITALNVAKRGDTIVVTSGEFDMLQTPICTGTTMLLSIEVIRQSQLN